MKRWGMYTKMNVVFFVLFIAIVFFVFKYFGDPSIDFPEIPFFNPKTPRSRELPKQGSSALHFLRNQSLKIPFQTQPHFYEEKLFPGLKDLKEQWDVIRAEAMNVYETAPILKLHRQQDDWTQSLAGKDVLTTYKTQQGWHIQRHPIFTSPNEEWLNYGLVFHDEPLVENAKLCPKTMELLSHIEGINVAEFSWMTPHSVILSHKDSTGLKYDSLAYHLGLIVPKGVTNLVVDGETVSEEEGKTIIFDATFLHSAENQTEKDRIVLYIDFKLGL